MMKRTILLIEDDIDLRETTKEFLIEEGFETLAADNGAQGIQLAIQHVPDAIICDINMPGLSGYEVYNMLHQVTTTSVIPFIFLSAKSTKDDILTGLHLGADDYITKPFEFSSLLEIVNLRIENRKKIIEQHNEIFNVLFKNTHSGACILIKYSFEYVNDPLTKLLGYSADELKGISITNIIHRDSLQEVSQTLEQCMEGAKKSFNLVFKAICKSQEIKTLELKGSYILFKGVPSIMCTFAKLEEGLKTEVKEKKNSIPKISDREKEVLNLVCQGFSNSEIAEKLFLSERTIEGHRARLFSKTGTKNSVSLAMWAVKNDLVKVK
jgi:PAS domain S-box-containing protein